MGQVQRQRLSQGPGQEETQWRKARRAVCRAALTADLPVGRERKQALEKALLKLKISHKEYNGSAQAKPSLRSSAELVSRPITRARLMSRPQRNRPPRCA
jgi:hypothetical protein